MNELTERDWKRVYEFIKEIRKTLRHLKKYSERKDLFGVCVECGVLRTLANSLYDFVDSKWVGTSERLSSSNDIRVEG